LIEARSESRAVKALPAAPLPTTLHPDPRSPSRGFLVLGLLEVFQIGRRLILLGGHQ
jgi:hypothetical protein